MKTVAIRTGDHRLLGTVRETEDPTTWELEWSGATEGQPARRMLKAAKTSSFGTTASGSYSPAAQTKKPCAPNSVNGRS